MKNQISFQPIDQRDKEELMSKNILITGSGGILGTTILQKLINNSKNHIYAISSQSEKIKKKYKNLDNVHVYSSIIDIPTNTIDIAVNCAFPRTNNGIELAKAFSYTEKIIDQLSNKSIKNFINISSQSVYMQSGLEVQIEKSNVAPSNLYGMTKYAIEQLVRIKSELYNIEHVNIRLGSLVSPTFEQRMINRFYLKIVNQEPIIVDKGTPIVSYLHIEDAADAILLLVEKIIEDTKIEKLYNLANNDWMTISNLVDECLKYGEKLGIETSEKYFSEKDSDYNNVIDSSLFYEDMNWEPNYSMKDLVKYIFNAKYIPKY